MLFVDIELYICGLVLAYEKRMLVLEAGCQTAFRGEAGSGAMGLGHVSLLPSPVAPPGTLRLRKEQHGARRSVPPSLQPALALLFSKNVRGFCFAFIRFVPNTRPGTMGPLFSVAENCSVREASSPHGVHLGAWKVHQRHLRAGGSGCTWDSVRVRSVMAADCRHVCVREGGASPHLRSMTGQRELFVNNSEGSELEFVF